MPKAKNSIILAPYDYLARILNDHRPVAVNVLAGGKGLPNTTKAMSIARKNKMTEHGQNKCAPNTSKWPDHFGGVGAVRE
jgi:hypothetical protein